MLWEPGPLALFTEAEFPRAVAGPSIAGIVAASVAALTAEETQLGASASHVVGGFSSDVDTLGAFELAAATASTDQTIADVDTAIPGAANSAAVLETDLATMMGEMQPSLLAPAPPPMPPPPTTPVGGSEGGTPQL